jgi:hypothetical protein
MSGAGYIRRFSYFPGTTELQAIEGVVIVDQRSPGPIRGASTGVVAVVGECSDMSHACSVNTSGVVQSKLDPVEVYGSSDLIEKIGPFDRYLGEWGDEMGNLFAEVRNKQFSRLVIVPVDLVRPASGTSQYAVRIWRQLPTNRSATDPTPIVPVVGTRIPAGTRFDNSTNRCYLAAAVNFTGKPPVSTGVDGTTVTTSLPAATRTIVRAAGSWTTDGAQEGDLIVPGSLNAAAASQNLLCAGAGTLRITAVGSSTSITVQKLDGSDFTTSDWEAGSALAWRLHKASDGDSSQSTSEGHQLSEAAGYTVLARPGNATIASASALTPNPAPTAPSGTYWDVTAGLMGVTHPSGALTYDADVHAANLAATALLRSRYLEAMDSLLNDDTPESEVSVLISARKDATIQAYQRLHVLNASQRGMTRTTVISPKLTTLTKSTILGSAAPGVGGSGGGAVRHERVIYSWPGVKTFIPELVGTSVATADGLTTDDGILDTTGDTWIAALMSVLPPENNIGQAMEPVPTIFSPIISYQRGTPSLDMNDYILFKQYGIAAFRMDRTMGPLIQSGVTTSQTTGEANLNRRRMADFIQDSLAARYNQLAKMVARQSIKDTLLSETDAFLSDLLAEGNPDAQRIAGYSIDDKTLNTQSLAAQGIYVIKIVVQMLQTLDTIVLASEVGPNADITVRQV